MGCVSPPLSLIQNRTGDFAVPFARLRRSALHLFPQTFASVLANVCIPGCKRYQQTKTTDTLRVSTTAPQMHCANCEKKIKSNIRFVKGVRRIETSVPKQTVTIVYDSKKSNYEDFVEAFRKIGFTIDRVNRKK